MIGQIVKETDDVPTLYRVLVRDVAKDGWWREVGIYQEYDVMQDFIDGANKRGCDVRVTTYDPNTAVTSTKYPVGQDPKLTLVQGGKDG